MGVLNIYERSSFHSSRVVSGDIKGNRKRNPRISRFAKEIMYQSQSDSSMYKRGILVNSLSAEEFPLSSIYSCHMEGTKRCLKQRTWHISSRAWGTEAKSLTLDFCFPSSASSVASVQLPLSVSVSPLKGSRRGSYKLWAFVSLPPPPPFRVLYLGVWVLMGFVAGKDCRGR